MRGNDGAWLVSARSAAAGEQGQIQGWFQWRVAGPLLESLGAVAISFAICAVILLITGHDPVNAYGQLIERVLLRPAGLQETLVRATPLLIAGLAVLLAAKCGLWNIGIDGQVLMGALTAAMVGNWLGGTDRPVLWLGAIGAGVVGGALWATIPALLRSCWGINEIVTTIMFNYVAISLTAWLVKGPLRDTSLVAPQTPAIPREMRFITFGDTRVHIGLLIALGLWLFAALWLERSVAGFDLRAVGENVRAAHHAMLPVAAILVYGLITSGALAGVAGANDVLSTKGTFQAEWNPEYALSAFALVFLARQQVFALLPSALFIGALAYGADVMPRAADIPPAFFMLFEGILLIVLGCFRWKPWTRKVRFPR